ncbi:reverse transcriptase domain-containing protein [Tanacetum coccineum]
MTRSTVRSLTKLLDKPKREFRRLRKAAKRSHQNESLAIARRNLFDDEASYSNNTGAKLPTPPKTLHKHSRPNSYGFQNPITFLTKQTGRIFDSRDIWLIQSTCTFQGLRKEDPLHHVKHYLSIIDNIQADEATRNTSRLKKQKKDDEDERLLSIFKQIHINLPFLEAMIHMPKGAKVLKDLLSHKEKLKKATSSVKLNKEEEDSNKALAVSFYPRTEPVEPLKWKASENRLKPSSIEPPKLELKELPKHLEINLSHLQQSLGKHYSGCPKERRNDRSNIPQWKVTGWRICINYRKLNNATRKDHFPLLFIDQMLERLAGHEYFCFLDGFSGYFQIPIAPEDQEKTMFTCPYETFTYKRMPFGLCNASATFQCCMTAIFHELIEDNMEVFMDDFSIFGSSFDHCLKNLEKMLKMCEETNLVLNWEKCHFMVKEGIVLGHKVSGSGIEVNKVKIKAISKLPYPTNVKAIRSFLGHAGFYRRFIKDFSQIARPITQILVKDAPFNFSEECIKAFDTLKREMTQAPIMIKLDWSLPFEIMCDASDYAVGAILGQRIDKHFKPIHYASKIMNEAQENYTTTEKELLAVIFAFDKFCQYLVLSKTIIHDKKEAKNLVADHLSRLENPDLGMLTRAEIRDLFTEERLMEISNKNNELWLYLTRRSLKVLRKFHWMILGGRFNQLSHVSSPLLSKPGEY